jgi:hypothetical protein
MWSLTRLKLGGSYKGAELSVKGMHEEERRSRVIVRVTASMKIEEAWMTNLMEELMVIRRP